MNSQNQIDTSTVKYLINANFSIQGMAERSDVIGAIFGQTEGLLGDGLDLRELQKTSRIGRIVVKLQYQKAQRKTTGVFIVPSSLDRVETAILAASLETVDRVGPCVAEITLQKIEDVRESKRTQIVKRATSILKTWDREVAPESVSIVEEVLSQARVSVVQKYGPEGLPSGSGINASDSLIVVEGRADVVTLLRHGFRNVIAVEGTSIPKTVIEITKRKVTTAFLDGDRGGDLILKELLQVADIDYIARAPEGREVEELSSKEILKSLRTKLPIEQFIKEEKITLPATYQEAEVASAAPAVSQKETVETKKPKKKEHGISAEIESLIKQVKGTYEGVVVDKAMTVLHRVPVRELRVTLANTENLYGAIFDGVITQRLLDLAIEHKLKFIAGAKLGEITKKPLDLEIIEFPAH